MRPALQLREHRHKGCERRKASLKAEILREDTSPSYGSSRPNQLLSADSLRGLVTST